MIWVDIIHPKEFERVYDSLKEYNTDTSYEIYEGTAIDKDGIVILVVITIINLEKEFNKGVDLMVNLLYYCL